MRTQEGVTPLHFAACVESPKAIRWLISNGADVDLKVDSTGDTVLYLALSRGNLENFLALVEAGAQFINPISELRVHPQIFPDLLQTSSHYGSFIPSTVLEAIRKSYKLLSANEFYDAIVDGNLEACRSIVESGNMLAKALPGCDTCTPLITALAWQEIEIVTFFLQREASVDASPCLQTRGMGVLFTSALNIAISRPIFNDILGKLCSWHLERSAHWSAFRSFEPLHLAALSNPGGIGILVDHTRTNEGLSRYVKRHINCPSPPTSVCGYYHSDQYFCISQWICASCSANLGSSNLVSLM